MEIVYLPRGERAANDVDCVHIERTAQGQFDVTGSTLQACPEDTDEAQSIALIGGELYDSEEEAEAAGVAWAAEQCVELLYVSKSGFGGESG